MEGIIEAKEDYKKIVTMDVAWQKNEWNSSRYFMAKVLLPLYHSTLSTM